MEIVTAASRLRPWVCIPPASVLGYQLPLPPFCPWFPSDRHLLRLIHLVFRPVLFRVVRLLQLLLFRLVSVVGRQWRRGELNFRKVWVASCRKGSSHESLLIYRGTSCLMILVVEVEVCVGLSPCVVSCGGRCLSWLPRAPPAASTQTFEDRSRILSARRAWISQMPRSVGL